jgi:eukaryotic-like serine/threonine-protein kinase
MTETKPSNVNSLTSNGDAILGNYVLVAKIAQGGMAEVFLGRKRSAPPEAPFKIIKCILPEIASDPEFVAMFLNEAQLAAHLNHPNIVRVLDFGEHKRRLFMVMEYVDGLDCWRFSRRLYPWGDNHVGLAILIVCDVLRALEAVHKETDVNGHPLNVIHRDLSPSNIYLSRNGEVKLGDFGIARIDSKRYRQVTAIPKGKFGYIAPEQVDGHPIDQRADIFAMGIVLTELLLAKKLFTGASQLSVMLEILEGRLDTFEQNSSRIEPELQAILRLALARDLNQRYNTATVFREALEEYADKKNITPTRQQLAEQVGLAAAIKDLKSSIPALQVGGTPITRDLDSMQETTQSRIEIEQTTKNRSDEITEVNEATPVTRNSTPFSADYRYTAQLQDGRHVGPTTYAHLLELVYSDEIGPDTLISLAGSPFVPASSYAELNRHLPSYTPTEDVDDIRPADKRGDIATEAPAEVILSLALARETGVLIFRRGFNRKEIYFSEGEPVYVASNNPNELLGEFLVSHDLIKRHDLDLALALLPKFDGHMGDTLIALGILSAVQLFEHIGDQIKERFNDAVTWLHGKYEFYRGETCRADVLEVSFEPFSTVRESVVRNAEQMDLSDTLDTLSTSTVSPTPKAKELLTLMAFPPQMNTILRNTSVPSQVAALYKSTDNSDQKQIVVQTVYSAIETGIWSLEGSAPPPWRQNETRDNIGSHDDT